MAKKVLIRSGVNRLDREIEDDVTVGDIFDACGSALNITSSSDLNVAIDNVSYSYREVEDDIVDDGAVIEFVKTSGTKG